MADFSNTQKLAAVITEWAKPAISQIATSKLAGLPIIQSMQNSLVKTGIVGVNYRVANDLMPFLSNGITGIIQPVLETYLSKIPDASLPQLAHTIVDTAMEQPKFSILDGLVEFEQNDMIELKDLLEKNLPLTQTTGYKIIK